MRGFLHRQPKTEDDIKCDKDCMIRCVVNVTGQPYKDIHKLMYDAGWRATRRKSKGNWEDQILTTLDKLGFKYEKISYPGIKGESRMTALKMSEVGSYILRVSKHVSVLKDGILMDTWDCSNKCVYFAWKVEKK